MERAESYFFLFATIHDVLKAEKLLKHHLIDVEIVPVPRSVSSDCGVCIKSKSPAEALFPLLLPGEGVRCYVFDGVEYRPAMSHRAGDS